jgi:hypothetical protein
MLTVFIASIASEWERDDRKTPCAGRAGERR